MADKLQGFGFVVPFAERRSLLACTFASRKYPGRAPEGHELLRAFVGGARRPDLVELDDESLRRPRCVPSCARCSESSRSPSSPASSAGGGPCRSMPSDTWIACATSRRRAAALPGLALAGAAYRGVGIPDCVRSGEAAADAIAERPR